MIVHELSRTEARRIAVRAQLLDSTRPSDLAETVRRLTLLQNDLTAAVAPSAELVAWSRLGSSCPRSAVSDAVEEQSLIDLQGRLRPAEDLVLYRAEMAEWPGADGVPYWLEGQAAWVRANDGFRRDLLDELMRDGPLTRHELPDTCTVPWRSSGWNNNRNVAMMLEMLVLRSEVAVAGRRGRDKVWDLASRIYPMTRSYLPQKRIEFVTSAGCAPWVLRAPGDRSAQESRTSVRADRRRKSEKR